MIPTVLAAKPKSAGRPKLSSAIISKRPVLGITDTPHHISYSYLVATNSNLVTNYNATVDSKILYNFIEPVINTMKLSPYSLLTILNTDNHICKNIDLKASLDHASSRINEYFGRLDLIELQKINQPKLWKSRELKQQFIAGKTSSLYSVDDIEVLREEIEEIGAFEITDSNISYEEIRSTVLKLELDRITASINEHNTTHNELKAVVDNTYNEIRKTHPALADTVTQMEHNKVAFTTHPIMCATFNDGVTVRELFKLAKKAHHTSYVMEFQKDCIDITTTLLNTDFMHVKLNGHAANMYYCKAPFSVQLPTQISASILDIHEKKMSEMISIVSYDADANSKITFISHDDDSHIKTVHNSIVNDSSHCTNVDAAYIRHRHDITEYDCIIHISPKCFKNIASGGATDLVITDSNIQMSRITATDTKTTSYSQNDGVRGKYDFVDFSYDSMQLEYYNDLDSMGDGMVVVRNRIDHPIHTKLSEIAINAISNITPKCHVTLMIKKTPKIVKMFDLDRTPEYEEIFVEEEQNNSEEPSYMVTLRLIDNSPIPLFNITFLKDESCSLFEKYAPSETTDTVEMYSHNLRECSLTENDVRATIDCVNKKARR